jgi:hypothetical protein
MTGWILEVADGWHRAWRIVVAADQNLKEVGEIAAPYIGTSLLQTSRQFCKTL